MSPSGGNPFDTGGGPFGGGGFGEEPPMDGSFGFLSGDEGAALFGEDLKAKKDDEIIGIGLHFCERLKE